MTKDELAAGQAGQPQNFVTGNGLVANGPGTGGQAGSVAGVPGAVLPTGGAGVVAGGATGGGGVSDGVAGAGGATTGGGAVEAGGATTNGGSSAGGTTAGGSTTGGGSTEGGTAASASAPCTSKGAPVVIGQSGAFSGVIGQATGDQKLGMSVWTKWVNDNGGIQCHPVVLYQNDDGADPSKGAANINDLVKNKNAVAIVGLNSPVTVVASSNAATKLGVPVVGGDLADVNWYGDPNLFPNGTYSLASWGGGIVQALQATKSKKFALLYCVEATVCQAMNQNLTTITRAAKPEIVMKQGISITQTDYTAECQNAKNSGAQVLGAWVDAASIQRIARACISINYRPVLVTGGLALSSTVFQDKNILGLSLYAGDGNAIYTESGTPALDAVHTAFKKYTGGDIPDQPAMKGWAAGMLFKAAIDKIGTAARQGPITPAMVYEGLYRLKNETLGGLSPALTFVKGKGAPQVLCYSTMVADNKGIRSLYSGYRCNPM